MGNWKSVYFQRGGNADSRNEEKSVPAISLSHFTNSFPNTHTLSHTHTLSPNFKSEGRK